MPFSVSTERAVPFRTEFEASDKTFDRFCTGREGLIRETAEGGSWAKNLAPAGFSFAELESMIRFIQGYEAKGL